MLRGKCVQNRTFVAKFGYLWRNLGVFVAKKTKIKGFCGRFSLILEPQNQINNGTNEYKKHPF
jgi:hypothetical protein